MFSGEGAKVSKDARSRGVPMTCTMCEWVRSDGVTVTMRDTHVFRPGESVCVGGHVQRVQSVDVLYGYAPGYRSPDASETEELNPDEGGTT
jgi:hypothetical protein